MAETSHPNYPESTIQEAVCQISFKADGWHEGLLGHFHERVMARFENSEPASLTTFTVKVGEEAGTIAPPETEVVNLMRFTESAGRFVLTLAPEFIAIHAVSKYPGWSHMVETIELAWQAVREVINPEVIRQINLKYINSFARRAADETLGQWLRAGDYIPPAVLRSTPLGLNRIEVNTEPGDALVIILTTLLPKIAEGNSDAGSNFGVFIFDIERTRVKEQGTDLASLLQVVEGLHDDVWVVFSSAVGERLENYLQGRLI